MKSYQYCQQLNNVKWKESLSHFCPKRKTNSALRRIYSQLCVSFTASGPQSSFFPLEWEKIIFIMKGILLKPLLYQLYVFLVLLICKDIDFKKLNYIPSIKKNWLWSFVTSPSHFILLRCSLVMQTWNWWSDWSSLPKSWEDRHKPMTWLHLLFFCFCFIS